MTLYDYHLKTPTDVKRVRFDFTKFVAQVSPTPVTYTLMVQPGLSVVEVVGLGGNGVMYVDVSGGVMGRAYLFGYMARGGSESEDQTRRMRIVSVSELAGLVAVTAFDLAFVTEAGDVMVTQNGDALAWS